MTVPAVAAVQGRIAALQSRFLLVATVDVYAVAPGAATAAPTAGPAAAAPAATPAPSFAETLGGLLGAPVATPVTVPVPGADVRPRPATGADVVEEARRYLGVPYVWGSEDPARGLDCSALVDRVYREVGVELPRVSRDQAREGRPVADLRAARPGDLLFFGSPVDHVGIYAGDGRMIHAPRPGRSVSSERVYETPVAIRRLLPDVAPAPAPAAPPAPGGRAAEGGLGAVPYAGLFRAAAARHGLDPALLAAVAKVESGYDPRALSPAGARGLMQLMPGTAAELGVDPLNPAQAVDGAARLLRANLRRFGSLELALAAYNAGPGAVRRFGGIPPYAETRAYVPKVLAAVAEVRA